MKSKALKGLTLIELIAVLAIISLMLGLSLPSLGSLVRDASATAATNDLITSANWARNQAVMLGQRVAVCRSGDAGAAGVPKCDIGPSTDAAHDGYEDGWIIFTDPDHDWQPNQPSDILRRYTPDFRFPLTIRGQLHGNNADHFAFTSRGLSSGTTGTLVICDNRGWQNDGEFVHAIVISADGRIRAVPGNTADLSVKSCTP
jgi:type IV fimbrial biogenesis protein FimT